MEEMIMQILEECASTWYDDFNELQKDNPSLGRELKEEFGNGEWQKYQLFVYESLEDYAYYQLTEGWYLDLNLDKRDYHGAPDPLDFIDLKALGQALSEGLDESCCYLANSGAVVESSEGWS